MTAHLNDGPLGFGCSSLLGPVPPAVALRTLEVAFDAGITHFDVARSYGAGQAETVVGRFIEHRRDQVTVTSKFGIAPGTSVMRHRRLLQVARRAMRLSPALRRALGNRGAKMVKRGVFDPTSARASLETTLRELKTDYLDVLLLHDPEPEDCSTAGLLDFLLEEQASGRVRAFGVGTGPAEAAAIVRSEPPFSSVVQIPDNALAPTRQQFEVSGSAVMTHGPMACVGAIERRLRDDTVFAAAWRATLGDDRRGAVAELALQEAVTRATAGPVLFSSVSEDHVRANAQAVATIDPARIEAFRLVLAGTTGVR